MNIRDVLKVLLNCTQATIFHMGYGEIETRMENEFRYFRINTRYILVSREITLDEMVHKVDVVWGVE